MEELSECTKVVTPDTCEICGEVFKNERGVFTHKRLVHFDTLKERFMDKVEKKKNGCWEWAGATNWAGYGLFTVDGDCRRAHRVMMDELKGHQLGDYFVLHKCDNKPCVNPDHLYLGTHEQNMKDAHDRQNKDIGENNPQSELTDEEAREIKRRAKDGENHRIISEDFGCNRSLVTLIANDKRWSHIELEDD